MAAVEDWTPKATTAQLETNGVKSSPLLIILRAVAATCPSRIAAFLHFFFKEGEDCQTEHHFIMLDRVSI